MSDRTLIFVFAAVVIVLLLAIYRRVSRLEETQWERFLFLEHLVMKQIDPNRKTLFEVKIEEEQKQRERNKWNERGRKQWTGVTK